MRRKGYEEFKEVGEVFDYNGIKLEIYESEDCSCDECYFFQESKCIKKSRTFGRCHDIIFKKVSDTPIPKTITATIKTLKESEEKMKKAYKVFNSDWTCRGFQYKVGEKYIHEGKIKLCGSGFHSCINPIDCFSYYSFDPKNKVAEVELSGDIISWEDKSVSSEIKIIREIEWLELLVLVNTGKNNTGYSNSGDSNSGNSNSGGSNSGGRNSGGSNSGDNNSGNWNSGGSNSGNWNSGNWNSGDSNSGYRNSGNWNSGDRNSGYRNSGDSNSGNWNSGNWNSCNRETGFFNSEDSEDSKIIKVFNKTIEKLTWENSKKPSFVYFDLCCWVNFENMTELEKQNNKNAEFMGGYLKTLKYKEAWKLAWNKAKLKSDWKQEYEKLINLPNFNKNVFLEITGIDIEKE